MREINSCCGVGEVDGLQETPKDEISMMCEDYFEHGETHFPIVVFTDNMTNGRGTRLCAFITKKKLGAVVASPIRKNPNTQSNVRAWVWSVNMKSLRSWWTKNKPADYDGDGGNYSY